MPRRRRAAQAVPEMHEGELATLLADPRAERVAAFDKTKMCKFFILGACTKGASCHFAHAKEDLKNLPDLARTKLCKNLINTGSCDDPECTYAHTKEELRPAPVPDAIPKRQQKQLLHDMMANQQHNPQRQSSPPQQRQAAPLQPQQLPPQHLQQRQQAQQQLPQLQTGQALAATAATAAASAGMPPMACAMPAMAFLANAQEPYAALLQQMGQAAQAHALEAARLQAMAAQMQGATAATAVQAHAGVMPYFMLNGGFAVDPQTMMLPQMVQLQAQAMAPGSVMPAGGNVGQQASYAAAPQAVQSSTAPSSQEQAGQDMGNLAMAMSRVLTGEPVQINAQTLRSMSSHSLCRMVPQEDDESASDEEPSRTNAVRMPTPKRSQDTPYGAPQMVWQAGEARQPFGAKGFDTSAITVKNTFVDIASSPAAALRSVRTYGGALSMLGRQSSTNALDILDE